MIVAYANRVAWGQDDTGSEDAVALFNAAQDLHERGDLTGAIQLYDKALKAVTEFPEAEYQRGVAQQQLGQRDEAEKSFRRSLDLRVDWSPALTSLGSLLIEKEMFVEAETLLARALAADPQNSSALAAMVDLRLKTKASHSVLMDLLDKVTALTEKANPTAAIWTARAALEGALAKHDSARASIENALRIDPKNRSALFLTADIALKNGDVVRAREAATSLEKLAADKQALASLRANIAAAETGDAANRADLEKLLETEPTNIAVLGKLCTMLRRTDPRKAIDYCRRAFTAEPSNPAHAVGYAAALVQAKQFDTAVVILRRLITITPDNWTAHANLATALFELKRYDEAREQYEWLTTKQPGLAAAYYFLGICFDRLGKKPDAMANYQQYLRLADPAVNKLDIERVKLRLEQLQKKTK